MIARKMSFSVFSKFFNQALGFVSLYFVAHYMGPEVMGIIAFSTAFIALFQSFADLGFGTAHIKRVSEGKDFGTCNGTYFTVKFVLNILMTLAVLLTVLISKYFFHKNFISKEHEIVLYILLTANFAGNLSMMFITSFSARREVVKSNVAQIIGKIVSVGGKVIVAICGLGVIMLAGVSVISAVVILICYIYFFKGYPIKKPSKEYFKSYLSFAIPVIFMGFISKYSANLDKIMIQFFWSTRDVGLYAASKRISLVLDSIPKSSGALIFPTISYYHSKGNIEAIRDLSYKVERYFSMLFFPIVGFIILFSKQICLILLGPEFSLLAPEIFVILSVVMLIYAIGQPYSLQIPATNHIKLAAVLSVITLGANIFLNIIFIPKEILGIKVLGMGAVGAAYATLISAVLGTILNRIYAYKITKSKPNLVIFIHLFASLIMALVLYVLSNYFLKILWYHLPLLALIGGAAYLAILVVMREFNMKELRYFLDILNPVKLKDYAKTEIREDYKEIL
jgi:O-antigen/teichoic acid export membrane protein